jgi:hypothetical protein
MNPQRVDIAKTDWTPGGVSDLGMHRRGLAS